MHVRARAGTSGRLARVAAPRAVATVAQAGADVVTVHAGDELQADLLRADRLALAVVRAGPEAGLVHRGHHAQHALVALRLALREQAQVRDLGGREEHGRGVG